MEAEVVWQEAIDRETHPVSEGDPQTNAAPLVSVIIRTMQRPELAEALDSVACQSYRHIEIILVDAKGSMACEPAGRCGEFPVRIASTGGPQRRSAAANLGLEAASGDYVVFLDDDDWFLPDHVRSLVDAVLGSTTCAAAYAGIECRTQDSTGAWESVYTFNQPYDATRLLVENYLPMHSVLFRRGLVAGHLRFDESLDVYEDWDFWIQLSAVTDLVHVDRVTAIYRVARESGFGVRNSDPAVVLGKTVFFEKWRQQWSLEQVLSITEYAKYHSMYHELVSNPESQAHRLAAALDQGDRDTAALARIQEQIAALSEANLVLEQRAQSVSNELSAARYLLRTVEVEKLDDALQIREKLLESAYAQQVIAEFKQRSIISEMERQESVRLAAILETSLRSQLDQAKQKLIQRQGEIERIEKENDILQARCSDLEDQRQANEREKNESLQCLSVLNVRTLEDALGLRDQAAVAQHTRLAFEDLQRRASDREDDQKEIINRIAATLDQMQGPIQSLNRAEEQRQIISHIATTLDQMQGPIQSLKFILDQARISILGRAYRQTRATKHATRFAVNKMGAGWERVRNLTILVREYGPMPVLRALSLRFRPAGEHEQPILADLWQSLSYRPIAFNALPAPDVSVLVDWAIGMPSAAEILEGLATSPMASCIEVLFVYPGGNVVAERIARQTHGLAQIMVDVDMDDCARRQLAIERARAEWLVVTSTWDVAPHDWIDRLLTAARRYPKTGAVCAKVVGSSWDQDYAIGGSGADGSRTSAQDPEATECDYLPEAAFDSRCCLLLNRKALLSINGSQEGPAVSQLSLTSMLRQLRLQGWLVYNQPSVWVDDWQSATEPSLEDTIRAVTSRRRVLVIDAVMLTPDQDSGSLRMFNLLACFLDLGWQVSFVPSNLELHDPYGTRLRALGIEVLCLPRIHSVEEVLERNGGAFDVVVLSRADVAGAFLESVRRHAPQASVWFDTVDLHFLRERREADLTNDDATRDKAEQRKAQELGLTRKADCTLVVSPVEQDLLAREVPGARIEILSNIHDLHPTDTPLSARDTIVFIGGFNHPPNVDAMQYYVREIHPLVHAELDHVPVYVIGSKPPPEILALADPELGIHITGFVPDVTDYYARARLSIAPLRYGAGVKGKINMSMAYGVPVVASPCAAEGMFLTPGRDILIGEDAEHFASEVIRLFRHPDLWLTLSQGGLANVQTHFSRETARSTIRSLVSELVK